jgi:hypothetical protein
VVKFTTPPSYTRKKSWYPLDSLLNEALWATELVWTYWRQEKCLSFVGIRNLNPLAHNIDAVPTTAIAASTRELLIKISSWFIDSALIFKTHLQIYGIPQAKNIAVGV